ncbi:isoleucine--tRNA ligase, chloroplastic/mitochondrial [Tanacetum coccineum]
MCAIFKIASTPTKGRLLDEFVPKLYLAIWTTTPWTIPANDVVAVNSKLQYAIVEVQSCSQKVRDFVAAHMSSKGIDLHTEECHHDLRKAEYKKVKVEVVAFWFILPPGVSADRYAKYWRSKQVIVLQKVSVLVINCFCPALPPSQCKNAEDLVPETYKDVSVVHRILPGNVVVQV